jgi:hypothetical protein
MGFRSILLEKMYVELSNSGITHLLKRLMQISRSAMAPITYSKAGPA